MGSKRMPAAEFVYDVDEELIPETNPKKWWTKQDNDENERTEEETVPIGL